MVKAFAQNVKDAGLSPVQCYTFPCVDSFQREIYNLFQSVQLFPFTLTLLLSFHVQKFIK